MRSHNKINSMFGFRVLLSIKRVFWLVHIMHFINIPSHFLGSSHWIWVLLLWDGS